MAMMTAHSPHTRSRYAFRPTPQARAATPHLQDIHLDNSLSGVRGLLYGLLGSLTLVSGGIVTGLAALRLM